MAFKKKSTINSRSLEIIPSIQIFSIHCFSRETNHILETWNAIKRQSIFFETLQRTYSMRYYSYISRLYVFFIRLESIYNRDTTTSRTLCVNHVIDNGLSNKLEHVVQEKNACAEGIRKSMIVQKLSRDSSIQKFVTPFLILKLDNQLLFYFNRHEKITF